mmetsp:Transcript_102422/g.294834  ORF Transcript_102422/g.294834 Transcript_102422/m.294834 type:complete len:287 (-) Transcript_102422:391-1251(-)
MSHRKDGPRAWRLASPVDPRGLCCSRRPAARAALLLAATSAEALGAIVSVAARAGRPIAAATAAARASRGCRGRRRHRARRWRRRGAIAQAAELDVREDGLFHVAGLGPVAHSAVEPHEVLAMPSIEDQRHAIRQGPLDRVEVVHEPRHLLAVLRQGDVALESPALCREVHLEVERPLRVDRELPAGPEVARAVAELHDRGAAVVASGRWREVRRMLVVRTLMARHLQRVDIHLHQIELGATRAADTIGVAIVVPPARPGGHGDQEERHVAPATCARVSHVHVHGD